MSVRYMNATFILELFRIPCYRTLIFGSYNTLHVWLFMFLKQLSRVSFPIITRCVDILRECTGLIAYRQIVWLDKHKKGITRYQLLDVLMFYSIALSAEHDTKYTQKNHDDVIKWKHFPRYWSVGRGNSPGITDHLVTLQYYVLWKISWSVEANWCVKIIVNSRKLKDVKAAVLQRCMIIRAVV